MGELATLPFGHVTANMSLLDGPKSKNSVPHPLKKRAVIILYSPVRMTMEYEHYFWHPLLEDLNKGLVKTNIYGIKVFLGGS